MEKCPKHTTKRNFLMVLQEKANGILMETIVISVMASIVFFSMKKLYFVSLKAPFDQRKVLRLILWHRFKNPV